MTNSSYCWKDLLTNTKTKKSEKSLLKKAAELIPQEPDLQDMVEVLQEKKVLLQILATIFPQTK